MKRTTWLLVVWALALAGAIFVASACASKVVSPPPIAATCKQGEPQELQCLRAANSMLLRQLLEAESDVSACSSLLKECESLNADH